MELIRQMISNPLYSLLVGSGGVLIIVITWLELKRGKKDKDKNEIRVEKSEKVKICNNDIKNGKIVVRKSSDTTVNENKG